MSKIIGIVGGVGPYTGTDLAEKIFNETLANKDQDHLPVALLSLPHKITDRTEYLVGQTEENPAYAVSEIILQLEKMGAGVVGIPCNTMHVPEIFDTIQDEIHRSGSNIILINMLDEVINFIREYYPDIKTIGVLSTTGTYRSGIYIEKLKERGYKGVTTDPELQEEIHKSIYDRDFGIKAVSNPVTKKSKNILVNGIRSLKRAGAEGIILGCTEIAFALPYKKLNGLPLFDATYVLARALIHKTSPGKLRTYMKP
jgi:aspartate racemase